MKELEVPKFKTYEEEADFWDKLDTAPFMEDDGGWFRFETSGNGLTAALSVDEKLDRKACEARAAALMQELDAIADSIEIRGEIDSAEELRQLREERTGRI